MYRHSLTQDSGVEQINGAIQQLSRVIQQNAAAAEEMSSTAEELASQAEQLQGTIAFFKMHEMEKELMRRTAQRAEIGLEEKHHKMTCVMLKMGNQQRRQQGAESERF